MVRRVLPIVCFWAYGLLLHGCSFEETDVAGTIQDDPVEEDTEDETPVEEPDVPLKCLNRILGEDTFEGDTLKDMWMPFLNGGGSIDVDNGELVAGVPATEGLKVAGLQSVATTLSLKESRAFVKISSTPEAVAGREARFDFFNPRTGGWYLLSVSPESVLVRAKAGTEQTIEFLGQMDFDDFALPLYMQMREENNVLFFEVGQSLENMAIVSIQNLNTPTLRQSILTSQVRVYFLHNNNAVLEPVQSRFDDFNVDPDCL